MAGTKKQSAAKTASGGARSTLAQLEAITDAVESGGGLTVVTRAAAAALNSSIAIVDDRGAVLAVAAASPADEKRLLAAESGADTYTLRIAEHPVGLMHLRPRNGKPADPVALRMATTLLAIELERTLAPEHADQEAAAELLGGLINGQIKHDPDVLQRATAVGIVVPEGVTCILVRATPRRPVGDGWRKQMQLVVERASRAVASASVAALVERPGVQTGEICLLVPGGDSALTIKVAQAVRTELEAGFEAFNFTLGHSRTVTDPGDLFRSGQEALLAVNVAEASGGGNLLSFEETGAYRLLLPAMCDDPGELRRFYAETIQPLAEYDDQYETDLVHTVDTFLAADANVAGAAQRLFTHRHTVRYRLERVKDLTGLDSASTDGREKLSLGLKAMRVLGIANPGGPAHEPGAEGGRVPRASD